MLRLIAMVLIAGDNIGNNNMSMIREIMKLKIFS